MGLLEQAKQDIQEITTDLDEWGVEMTLTAPTSETITLNGLHTKHHMAVEADTNKQVNSKNAHISISEQLLIDGNYPYTQDGEVMLNGHKVVVKDSTGTECTYVIRESFPDRTIGLIVCILGDFE